jgi:hypothetical protein
VDPQFIQVIDAGRIYPRDDTTRFLIQQKEQSSEPFRVFYVSQGGGYQTNQFAFYGIEELTGHHGNELGRYMDLIDFQRPGLDVYGVLRVLRLLNVRYLVSNMPLQMPGTREAYRGNLSLVYELDGAFPRAFLVAQTETLPDSLALERLRDPDFEPSESSILDRGLEATVASTAGRNEISRVTWETRSINAHTLRVETPEPALLVISDNYYPAWRATIDGEPAVLLRADYTLRAVRVPAGTHEVRIVYRSTLFRVAVWTTLLSAVFTGLVIGGGLYSRRRQRSATGPAEEVQE